MSARVSIIRCDDYAPENLLPAVKQAVDLLGGIARFVRPGQTVLIKPNLLRAATPEEAVTTHPEFVRAVIRLVKERSERIMVGDSPAGMMKAQTVYERCGLERVCREENAQLVTFDRIVIKSGMPFARIFDEADVRISLPKFKTHNLTTITGAVKNVFGVIPGIHKFQCHKLSPNHQAFSARLAEVYAQAKPDLSIVDAVWAMEADGPSAGRPRKLGLVVASEDAVAADAVLAKLIGLEPVQVASTREAHRRQLGCADLRAISVAGETIAEAGVRDFILPRIVFIYRFPNRIIRALFRLIPVLMAVDRRVCRRCMLCRQICPQQAIREVKGRLKIDARRCILCLCCSETCPENAVYIRLLKRKRRKSP